MHAPRRRSTRRAGAFRDKVGNRAAMQDRALSSGCSRLVRWSALALVAGAACTQSGPLSDEEMDRLRAFSAAVAPPPDTSNAFADNPAAARLGKKLYYDTGYSGALLAPYNVAEGVNGALGAAPQEGRVSCR